MHSNAQLTTIVEAFYSHSCRILRVTPLIRYLFLLL